MVAYQSDIESIKDDAQPVLETVESSDSKKDVPESFREWAKAGLALYRALPLKYQKGVRRIR